MKTKLLSLVISLLVLFIAAVVDVAPALAAPPPGFEDTLVTDVGQPTGIAFTPDGRLLITTQPGQLRIYQNGVLSGTAALNLSGVICTNSERGLLGVAVDPNFASNHFIYLYYTIRRSNSPTNPCPTGPDAGPTFPVNRVSRFILPDTNVISPTSELVLVDNILTEQGNHNAGDLHFGGDGFLYVSIGDGGDGGTEADNPAVLAGKMLRIESNGAIPASNPYAPDPNSRRCGDPAGVPAGNGPCQEVIAYGLRNPFRFAIKPGSNTLYINDVGQSRWEEIDQWSNGSGAPNYGWPDREGPCGRFDNPNNCSANPPGITPPIFYYNHNSNSGLPTDGCASITGAAFVPAGIWPAAYQDAYLFADYVCGKIFRLTPDGGDGFTLAEFVTGLGNSSAVAMIFGPYRSTQALYYTSYAGGGQVRRIVYTAEANQAPVAVAAAQPTYGLSPLLVTFNGAGSSDPDNDPLTFDWDFGDGAILTGTTNLTVTHSYAANGVYTATLIVRDDHAGISLPAQVRIDVGNTPPAPAIALPLTSTRFYVGQPLTLQGSAADNEDGSLPNSALTWEIILHHIDQQNPGNVHTHPFLSPTQGNNIPVIAPPAEDLRAAALSYLEIKLTATDSLGLARTITQTLEPKRVNLTFATQPPGLRLEINNEVITTPQTFTSWQAYAIQVKAPLSQTTQIGSWNFVSWSDSGAATHGITTPATAVTYTAVYTSTSITRFLFPVIWK
jgi:glucose/arabinose dehydrogenase